MAVIIEFLMHIRIGWCLLAFMVKILWTYVLCCCVILSKNSGRNVDVSDQLQSGRPVTAAHHLNRQKVKINLLKNTDKFLMQP
jgi:hypothetical protein